MKKKYLFTMLAFLVALCGFSAWSAKDSINPLADEAETVPLTLNVDQCVPAEGATVYELKDIIFTFAEDQTGIELNPDYTASNIGSIGYYDASTGVNRSAQKINDRTLFDHQIDGKEVAANQIVYHLPTPITVTEPLTYSVAMAANSLISKAGETNEQFKYTFTIEPAPVPVPLTLNVDQCVPAEGATVYELKDIVFTFAEDQTGIELNPDYTASNIGSIGYYDASIGANRSAQKINDRTLFDHQIDGKEVAANQIVYHLPTPITVTEPLTYSVTMAANSLISKAGGTNEQFKYTFTIEPAPAPLTLNVDQCVPAEGSTVMEVSYVVLTFGEGQTDIKLNPDHAQSNVAFIANVNGSTLIDFRTSDAESFLTHEINGEPLADNQIGIKLDKPLTTQSALSCRIYVNRTAFISGKTGTTLDTSANIYFTLTPAPKEERSIISTDPADGAKVEGPVSTIIFTVDNDMAPVDENKKFIGESKGGIVNVVTNEVVESLNDGTFTYTLNGEDLPEDQIAYILKTPIVEPGTYKVTVSSGVLNNKEYQSAPYDFTFTIMGNEPPVETFDYIFTYASWGVYNNYDYTYRHVDNEFTSNILFQGLPAGAALDSSKVPAKWVRESDGTVVEANITSFLGSMMMFTQTASWPADPFGVWTCVLPQGLFTSGEKQSVEKTIKVTWVNPNPAVQRPDFEVTKFSFFNTPDSFENLEGQPNGAPATMMFTLWKTVEGGEDMMDWETSPKKIAALNSNRGFVINTTWDEWIQCFIAEVTRKDGTGVVDVWNQETVQEIYGTGTVCKNYVGSSAANCEAYQHPLLGCGGVEGTREYTDGVVYTLDIWFYDSMQSRGSDNSKEHNLAVGKYHMEFTGATVPFEYSDIASLVSVSPVPANAADLGLEYEEAGTVTSVTQPITFTWSAPVTMTATYSLGGGAGQANVQSCTSNEDGTVWTVITGASPISNGEGGYLDLFSFNVQAVDADGHYVKGNAGEKMGTMFTPEFKFELITGINTSEDLKSAVASVNGGIVITGLTEGETVCLYSIEGIKVAERKADDFVATFSDVVPGTYLIVVSSENNVTATVKFLHK